MKKSALVGPEVKIYLSVHDALIGVRLDEDTANRYSWFAVQIYTEVAGNTALQGALSVAASSAKEAYPGLKQWYRSTTMAASDTVQLGYLKAAGRGAARGAGGEIAGFFDIVTGIAKANHIVMNDCALAITKVMLDVLAGIELAGTVVAAWAAAFYVLSLVQDSREMVNACS